MTATLSAISRGATDPARTAAFLAWLLDLEPQHRKGEFRFSCSNGWLAVCGNPTVPVAIELSNVKAAYAGADPDGILVSAVKGESASFGDVGVSLDHVAVTCADIEATMCFYRQLGLVCTWSAQGDDAVDGLQDEPVDGADWIHLSGADGYLSLSQADWADYGTHNSAVGPPRLIHIGLAVSDLAAIRERLDGAGTAYLPAPASTIGDRVYLNDPEGDPARGMNLELTQYAPDVTRSGRLRDAVTGGAG